MTKKDTKIDDIRHTLAHLLAMAVLEIRPNAKLGIGPTIENGFYYDFELKEKINDSDLKKIEKSIKKLISKNLEITGKHVSVPEAKILFKDEPYKLDLIDEYTKEKRDLSVYTTGIFTDLCKGGHVSSTKEINPDAFTITKTAGAYWRGDEKKSMLTRIYGVAFETKKELDDYLNKIAEAEKRDHRKLGRELDLFTFSDLVGPGLPLWTPKGTTLRNLLDDYVWTLRKEAGYKQIDIPHITKKDLYEQSGHWEKFSDELFEVNSREGHRFVIKPMNCPHHTQIYNRRPHSYKELPVRYANTTKVYRDEQSGELAGLTRVRSITQDDAHAFLRKSQIKDEIISIWNIIETFYSSFNFELQIRLSVYDPRNKKAFLGDNKTWNEVENILRDIIKKKNSVSREAIGEAAFYGPKIDFMAKDSLDRVWQVATIQLDFNLPERFDLSCINEKGEKERIVMIHAAIMGSIERFIAILIEHTAGAFPIMFSPVQVKVLTVNDKVAKIAQDIADELDTKGIRVEVDDRTESIGKKIREAELEKTPFIIIVGDKEAGSGKISVRKRGEGDIGEMKLKTFISEIK